ncbi:MAG: helix-turn-helix domain-containing protein [Bdellovibrionales bacterium]
MTSTVPIPNSISYYRHIGRLSVSDLASRIGIEEDTLKAIECGQAAAARTINKISDALGIPVKQLMEAEFSACGRELAGYAPPVITANGNKPLFPNSIRYYRWHAKMTASTLGELTGSSENIILEAERGNRLTKILLNKIGIALDVSTDKLSSAEYFHAAMSQPPRRGRQTFENLIKNACLLNAGVKI